MQWKRSASVALEKYAGLRVTRVRQTADGKAKAGAAAAAPAKPAPPKPKPKPRAKPDPAVARSARPPADPEHDRLLKAPLFVLSAPRSGSTLLRVVLNSHPGLHAPIETHVRRLIVKQTTPPVEHAMEALGHNLADVEHLLWDRVLHRELVRSGKETVVEKTPSNVFVAHRFAACWPDARFIFLMRHPVSIARSWHEGDPEKRPLHKSLLHTRKYMEALEEVRHELPGLTVRYEELTDDPEGQTRRICEFLGIEWDERMVSYGKQDHGEYRKGIGDWKEKIRSGTIQRGRALPTPEEIPEELWEMCKKWEYLPADAVRPAGGEVSGAGAAAQPDEEATAARP